MISMDGLSMNDAFLLKKCLCKSKIVADNERIP